jgi:hypothetical protein
LDFVPHSLFQKLENTAFWKLDLFPNSSEGETPTLLGPLERANHDPVTKRLALRRDPIRVANLNPVSEVRSFKGLSKVGNLNPGTEIGSFEDTQQSS